jgi:tetratricopeptide (TPR) repeat protein
MATPIRMLVYALVAWLWLGSMAAPQTGKPAQVPEQLPVYVVDFRQELRPELANEFGDLSAFTSGLIQLRLLEIPSVTVHKVQTAPLCENTQPQANQLAQTLGSPVAPLGDFYIVRGLLETQLPNVVLTYSVEKCEAKHLKKVFEDTQPFTLDHALDQITIAAHAIAFKIEKVIPPTQVDVSLFQIDGDSQEQKDIAIDVHNAVAKEISKSPDYDVTNSADYKIKGHITFQRSTLRVFSNGGALTAEMHIEAHGKSYPLKSITGSRDQLPKFNGAITDEVMRGLPEVLLAEHLQLSGFVENMKADELASQANQLLDQCSANETECATAQDAVTLLSAATQQDSKSWRTFLLLGRAQMLAGKSGDAVASLNKAQDLMKQAMNNGSYVTSADQVQLLNQLGNGYRSTNRYELAQNAYDESLRLDSAQAAIYRSKAQTYQFENNQSKALQSLIDGLKVTSQDSETQSLHDSAKNVIFALQDSGEIDAAETSLHAALLAGVPVSNEYALLVSRKWSQVLQISWSEENRAKARESMKQVRDLQLTDPDVIAMVYGASADVEVVNGDRERLKDFVVKAEQLPANQVAPYIREWIERIKAQDYINHAEYAEAVQAADVAYHVQPSDTASYMIADATLLDARCKEKTLRLGKELGGVELCKRELLLRDEEMRGDVKLTPSQQIEIRNQYQAAADRAAPLVAKRDPNGDGVLMRSNHSLGEDRQTQKQFTAFVQQDPKDQSALNILMYVCSQYVFDFDCAFSAAKQSANSLSKTGPTASGDYLNIAETAVLKGDDTTAQDWLEIAASQPNLNPRDASLIYLYRLWVAMRKGQTAEYKTDFESWQEATGRFRSNKEDLNWIFRGAREALDRSKSTMGESRSTLLVKMMDALDDSSVTLPSLPGPGML